MKVYNYSSLNRQQHVASSRRKSTIKRARTHLGLFNNPFKINFSSLNGIYFQVIGILMITVGAIISFQGLMDFSSPETAAGSQNNRDSVRVLTNFETETKRSVVPKVELIQVTPAPTKDSPVKDSLTSTEKKSDVATTEKEVSTEQKEEIIETPNPVKLEIYIVESGDTLASVAAKFGIDEAKFIEVNNLTAPFALQVDQKLSVPQVN
jgi:LysM repeat protein